MVIPPLFIRYSIIALGISSLLVGCATTIPMQKPSNRPERKNEKGISDYNKTIEINPDDYYAYYNRGIIYGKKGQCDEAIADYSKAIEINPNFSEAYCVRGIAYVEKDQNGKAIADFNKAIEITTVPALIFN